MSTTQKSRRGWEKPSASSQIQNYVNELTPEQTIAHRTAFLHLMHSIVGAETKVHLQDERKVTGIFHTATPFEKGRQVVVIKSVHINKENAQDSTDTTISDGSSCILEYPSIKSISTKPIELNSRASSTEFRTDSATKKSDLSYLEGRQLQAVDNSWLINANETETDRSGNIGKWNQFEANERMFNVKSTYDENLYTSKLDLNSRTPDEIAKAERLAREIENSTTSNVHLQEERGQAQQNDGLDEEDRYSGVLRSPGMAARAGGRGGPGRGRGQSSTMEENKWRRGVNVGGSSPQVGGRKGSTPQSTTGKGLPKTSYAAAAAASAASPGAGKTDSVGESTHAIVGDAETESKDMPVEEAESAVAGDQSVTSPSPIENDEAEKPDVTKKEDNVGSALKEETAVEAETKEDEMSNTEKKDTGDTKSKMNPNAKEFVPSFAMPKAPLPHSMSPSGGPVNQFPTGPVPGGMPHISSPHMAGAVPPGNFIDPAMGNIMVGQGQPWNVMPGGAVPPMMPPFPAAMSPEQQQQLIQFQMQQQMHIQQQVQGMNMNFPLNGDMNQMMGMPPMGIFPQQMGMVPDMQMAMYQQMPPSGAAFGQGPMQMRGMNQGAPPGGVRGQPFNGNVQNMQYQNPPMGNNPNMNNAGNSSGGTRR